MPEPLTDHPDRLLPAMLDRAAARVHRHPQRAERIVRWVERRRNRGATAADVARARYLRAKILTERGELDGALQLIGGARELWTRSGNVLAALRVDVVAAAGNTARDKEAYPADHRHGVSVTSVSVRGGGVSKFANWGSWVDVAAPASRVRGPVPSRGFARWAGTSMAAPQVSGQLALVIAAGADAKERQDALRKTAHEFGDDAPKEIKYGTVDLLASLRYHRAKS